jgi:O-antigen/teichoic acid export membrane protein
MAHAASAQGKQHLSVSLGERVRFRVASALRGDLRFLESVAIYGFGVFGFKALDLISFAVLVRSLTAAELGFVGTAILSGFLITEVFSLGVFHIAVPRFIMDGPDERRKWLNTALGAYLIYFALYSILFVLIPAGVIRAIGLGDYAYPFKIYGIAFMLRCFMYMELEIMRMDHRPKLQAVVEMLPSSINLVCLFILLPVMKQKVEATAWAMLTSWALPFAFFFTRAVIRHRPTLSGTRSLLRYSAPMIVHRTLSEMNSLASRWLVLICLGLSAAGVFTFFMRVGDLLKLAQQPLIKAWIPTMLSASRDGETERLDSAAVWFVSIGTVLFLASLLICRFAAAMIDDHGRFAATYNSIPVVVFAGWILGFYQVFAAGFFIHKSPQLIAPITTATAIINLVVSYAFIKMGTIYDVPYAGVISNAIFAILSGVLGARLFRFRSKRLYWVTVGCLAVGLAAFAADRALSPP